MRTQADLIQQARDYGCSDSYSFAEWLVDDQEYYGKMTDDSDLESAWMEAEAMWDRGTQA